ncbi:MAG: hypothetical protein WBJ81_04730 [Rickettsiales bacterium]
MSDNQVSDRPAKLVSSKSDSELSNRIKGAFSYLKKSNSFSSPLKDISISSGDSSKSASIDSSKSNFSENNTPP